MRSRVSVHLSIFPSARFVARFSAREHARAADGHPRAHSGWIHSSRSLLPTFAPHTECRLSISPFSLPSSRINQTSPTSRASTCGEGVGTGRTHDTPKATQAMTGATRTRAPQDQATKTPAVLTLSRGLQTGGGTIGWAHQGHPGTRGLPLTLLSRATHRTHMGRL